MGHRKPGKSWNSKISFSRPSSVGLKFTNTKVHGILQGPGNANSKTSSFIAHSFKNDQLMQVYQYGR